jgi:hypothetical protein
LPGGPFTVPVGCGVIPASTCTPGAVTSGLIQSPSGPRDENAAIMSATPGCAVPCAHVARTFVCVPMNVVRSEFGPSTWIAGSQWLSVSTSCLTGL